MAAAASGKPDALELVIQAGGSLKKFGGQAVNWALTKPKSLKVRASHGALDLPFQNHTPLAMEAMLGSVKNMKTLLDLGAKVNALSVGRPVLHWAALGLERRGQSEVAHEMRRRGADPKAALPFAKDAVMKAALKGKAAPKGAQASLRYDQVGE